ncbi:MAG: transglycosylase SLT domain-containing protein [Motiliproteus sp.]
MQPTRTALPYHSRTSLRGIGPQGVSIPHLQAILFAALLLLIIPRPASALAESEIDQRRHQLQQQRELYKQAHDALVQKKFKRATLLIQQLRSYPLYPYLLYQRHRLQLAKLNTRTLQQFKDNFADTPLPNKLHRAWLAHLGKRQQWPVLLNNYQPELANTSLRCQQLWALHQTGRSTEALQKVAPLWVQGRSQPKTCDKLFTAWLKSDTFTEQHAWDRFWLAMANNNPGLAKNISKRLQQPDRVFTAKQALQLYSKPEQLTRLDPDAPNYQQLLQYSIKRLGRRDPAQALQQLQQFKDNLTMDPDQTQKLRHRFGLRLLRSYPEFLDPLIQQINPSLDDKTLLEWQLRNLILTQDWQKIEHLIDQLPAPERFSGRWRYWKARSLETRSEPDPQERAQNIYAELANERNFYGFLSADKLGRSYSLNNQTELPDNLYLGQLSQSPAMLRARELLYQGQRSNARREWRLATLNLTSQQQHQAALLARQWGWYEQAIRSAITAKKWNDLMLRFPLAYSRDISNSAQSNKIDTSWIMAIARQESAFTPDARSPAGALGLMQLMPRTAKETAKKAKVRYRGSYQLTQPGLNVKLGSYYLASLSRHYSGHRVLASAAYNAGPGRVKGWLEQRKNIPIDIWIETIPFDETRNYVQNILSFSLIYSDMLGLPKQLLKPHERWATPPKRL